MANPSDLNTASSPDESPDIEQDVKGDLNQVIGQAINNNVVNAGDNATIHLPPLPSNQLDTTKHIPNNLPRSGAIAVVGRDNYVGQLFERFQSNERLAITAVQGMGGIGKTELALYYARVTFSLKRYPGGICWLRARDQKIATQIVAFAKANLGVKPPEELEADAQVSFIWQRWPQGDALIVIDDVTDYDAIALYLPPEDPRFKVLITTRNNLGAVTSIQIEELRDEDSVLLLTSLLGDERVESQYDDVKALCKWVGNLPLGLELVGRYLMRKKDWAIAKLLERLESKKLTAKALISSESGMTASLGVAAALELSWTELNDQEQDLACLLGMFAVAPIPWNVVEQCFEAVDTDDLEQWRDGLCDRSLIKRVDDGIYQLHQIVQEFFREKLNEKEDDAIALKKAFGRVMVAQAKVLDETPTLEQIELARSAIAHLEETANKWTQQLEEKDKIWPYVGISRFYEGQGYYSLSEPWRIKCLDDLEQLLGNDHQDVATSLNNLALIYSHQGRYAEAEFHYLKTLELRNKVSGNDQPDIAGTLNNLALLYDHQGRYKESESLNLQALELRKRVLGSDHPSVAQSLNNLALVFNHQGRHEEAKTLHLQALELRKKVLGNDHPSVAQSLNNLARLYDYQRRYEEAEPLYLDALKLRRKLLGNEHPDVATSLNNLARLYDNQGRYEEAEPLYLDALKLRKKLLGNEHPDVATSYFNMGVLYHHKGEYLKAKSLYLPALEIYKHKLGSNHSNTQNLLSCLNALPEGTESLPLEDLGL